MIKNKIINIINMIGILGSWNYMHNGNPLAIIPFSLFVGFAIISNLHETNKEIQKIKL